VTEKIDIKGIVEDAYLKAFDAIQSGVGDDTLAAEFIMRELGRRFIENAQGLEAEREKLSTPEGRAEIAQKFKRMVERALRGERMPTANERMDNLAKILSEGEECKREGWTETQIKDALLKSAARRTVQ
jgi:hypothetical protein